MVISEDVKVSLPLGLHNLIIVLFTWSSPLNVTIMYRCHIVPWTYLSFYGTTLLPDLSCPGSLFTVSSPPFMCVECSEESWGPLSTNCTILYRYPPLRILSQLLPISYEFHSITRLGGGRVLYSNLLVVDSSFLDFWSPVQCLPTRYTKIL